MPPQLEDTHKQITELAAARQTLKKIRCTVHEYKSQPQGEDCEGLLAHHSNSAFKPLASSRILRRVEGSMASFMHK
jgi:hypothetical protein